MKTRSVSKSRKVVPPKSILDDHTIEVRAIAEELSRLIRETLPEAIESGHPTWHSIGYRHPKAGYVCGIFPHKDSVDLVFEFGILLPDPHKVLQGNAKQTRYIPITNIDEINIEAITQLIEAALSLPVSRAIKLDLMRAKAKITG
jgi:hypothetical protein